MKTNGFGHQQLNESKNESVCVQYRYQNHGNFIGATVQSGDSMDTGQAEEHFIYAQK